MPEFRIGSVAANVRSASRYSAVQRIAELPCSELSGEFCTQFGRRLILFHKEKPRTAAGLISSQSKNPAYPRPGQPAGKPSGS